MMNQRLIEFKVWNKSKKKWEEYFSIDRFGLPYEEDYEKRIYHPKNWILIKSIGIRDKNNKKIFEGDVVRDEDCYGCTGIVRHGEYNDGEYRNYGWHIADAIDSDFEDFDHQFKLTPCCKEDIEVIGNIYDSNKFIKDIFNNLELLNLNE